MNKKPKAQMQGRSPCYQWKGVQTKVNIADIQRGPKCDFIKYNLATPKPKKQRYIKYISLRNQEGKVANNSEVQEGSYI